MSAYSVLALDCMLSICHLSMEKQALLAPCHR